MSIRGFAAAAAALWTAWAASSQAASPLTIEVLSNPRADLVSNGDVLVEIVLPVGGDPSALSVSLDGADVTPSFAVRPNGRCIGLVEGLALGENLLRAELGSANAELTIVNHPNSGPLFYGPQVQPWGCEAGAVDADCNRPASYEFRYKRTTGGSLQPYDPASPPADVATTTNDRGVTVPFIVRIERGAQLRDGYNVAVLYDPTQPWEPWAPQPGWNGKVRLTHGAGAGLGYNQFNAFVGNSILDEATLAAGYANVALPLLDNGHNINIAVAAEALIMAKEHVIENYGEIRYAIGIGSSGGGLTQQWLANAYPGLYDGLVVSAAFGDGSTPGVEIWDCAILQRYFNDSAGWAPGVTWTTAQRNAASGHIGNVCNDWNGSAGNTRFVNIFRPDVRGVVPPTQTAPSGVGGCDVPEAVLYNALTNPTGVRCTGFDYAKTIFGSRVSDGFGSRAISNVGVQYGLKALAAGTITPAQFVDLNAKVGSFDVDHQWQATRAAADEHALDRAYRSGWFNTGHNMGSVAIIDVRSRDVNGLHHQIGSWYMQARLDKALGHHENRVLWFNSGRSTTTAFNTVNQWLAAVEADAGSATRAQKIVANRPATLTPLCSSTTDGTGLTMEQCTGQADGTPRMGAGGALADDVVECQRKPLDPADYPVAFSADEWSQLSAAFPDGVCDWSLPGVGYTATVPWQTYLDEAGVPLVGGVQMESLVPGDLDGDGDLDATDYQLIRASLGKCAGTAGFIAAADVNANGCVDYRDYQTWYAIYRASL